MARSLLFITFQYPPEQASSGLLRSLSFSRDLADMGWQVNVLTGSSRQESANLANNEKLIPAKVDVIRTKAFDAAQMFSIGGKYPGFLEWPDRNSAWVLSSLFAGLRAIKQQKLQLIFSTYPVASAHLLGYLLSRISGKPLVADFRDPMVMANHPETSIRRRGHSWVEEKTIEHCSLALFTTEAAKTHYIEKYPGVSPQKFHVIENGYDSAVFDMAYELQRNNGQLPDATIRFLHSGTLYPDHRDPEPLFKVIAKLQDSWRRDNIDIQFIFRASGYDQYYQQMVAKFGLDNIVSFATPLSYIESIKETLEVSCLMLIQGASCNAQIPAKLYEYMHAKIPIIALVDPDGATAATLDDNEAVLMADPQKEEEIELVLEQMIVNLIRLRSGKVEHQPDIDTSVYSRLERSKQLNAILIEFLQNQRI